MGCFKLMYCSIKFQFKLYVSLFYDKALKLKLLNMFDFLTLYDLCLEVGCKRCLGDCKLIKTFL